MDEAYRDETAAALARVEALERENRELRSKNDDLERRLRAFEHASDRRPVPRHRGSMVVGWLVLTIGSILGGALFAANHFHHDPPAGVPRWTPTPALQAPPTPTPPVAPAAPSH